MEGVGSEQRGKHVNDQNDWGEHYHNQGRETPREKTHHVIAPKES